MGAEKPIRVVVIIGSTREGRFAPVVANWVNAQLSQRTDLLVDVIDLVDIVLPTVDPQFENRIAAADAFIVITPEYNHGYPGPLKMAIDSVYDGWQAKPVALVSYGGVSGGLRATEQLRLVFAELHAVTIRDTVSFHNASQQFTPQGEPRDTQGTNAAMKIMIDRLVWWALALREARQKRPYAL